MHSHVCMCECVKGCEVRKRKGMKEEGVNCKGGGWGGGADSRSLSIHGKLNPGKIQFGMTRIESCKIIARERGGDVTLLKGIINSLSALVLYNLFLSPAGLRI